MLPDMKRAKILIHTSSGQKELTCMFNPSQYDIKHKINYSEKKELGDSKTDSTYISSGSRELTMSLYFDSMGPPSLLTKTASKIDEIAFPVTQWTKKLAKATEPDGNGPPPQVTFIWGNLNFKGRISSYKEQFTMFSIGKHRISP